MKKFILLFLINMGISSYSQITRLVVINEVTESETDTYSLRTLPSNEIDNIDVYMYPNPVNDILNIEIKDLIYKKLTYRVYDNKSVLIFSKESFNNIEYIDFSNLPSQIYFVEITSDQTRTIRKIIKK